MTKNILIVTLFLVLSVLFITSATRPGYEPIHWFNRSGEVIFRPRILLDTITVDASGNSFSIDITSGGFTNVYDCHLTAIRNTTAVGEVPSVSIKSISNTAIVCNITENDFTGTEILGIPVFGGDGVEYVAANTVVLEVLVFGN